ncbi:hypothetical protein CsSME_00052921 [Camellia sinensis var. sinensis]
MALKLNEGDEVEIEPDPATWTALEEELYIQLMVKEVHKGNRSSTTFLRKGWKQIEQEFCEKTNKRNLGLLGSPCSVLYLQLMLFGNHT